MWPSSRDTRRPVREALEGNLLAFLTHTPVKRAAPGLPPQLRHRRPQAAVRRQHRQRPFSFPRTLPEQWSPKDVRVLIPGTCDYLTIMVAGVVKSPEMGGGWRDGLWRGRGGGPWSQGTQTASTLEKERKQTPSALKPPTGTRPCWHLILSPWKLVLDFQPLERKIINVACFKALSLWEFVAAATGSRYTHRRLWNQNLKTSQWLALLIVTCASLCRTKARGIHGKNKGRIPQRKCF